MALADLSDRDLSDGLREHGGQRAYARALGVPRTSLQKELKMRGLVAPAKANGRRRELPRLTQESLHRALQPPNTCKVRAFLDGLDDDSRAVVEEALGYDKQDFPAGSLRSWLISEGFREQDVPGSDAINDHRAGRRPCRCKG